MGGSSSLPNRKCRNEAASVIVCLASTEGQCGWAGVKEV